MTLSIMAEHYYAECCFCLVSLTLSVVMLSVVMLSVVMLNVVMLSFVMLNVVAPSTGPAFI